ncbi:MULTISPECIES: tRNA1(Val) (adenine(37)-N6)-methyltransferase [unclassified Enterococcus]|uniref:tRNA1(Val) (adenine(37)-N6)-methyltransferase n=1 Tax=unclassified Enterococcus TaxID=2608891 RepID=UPI001D3FEB5F|nr:MULTISPECIES: tRNA1(Val) (adenine(37)-N6)-methyltransferase [unclassified Enterococcus]NPD11340.1 tRNA1(Val) (adenine(37)-N6)-methyltransferase [Enterococcus sp. MMGLQ5-1]NPD36083.1 tRNA1(Val) (adenine(37)-N6)-methyltransferase [Enterococcus sp. MMGLQ5-2]
MNNQLLNENERIDQLYALGVKVIQSKKVFSYSIDSVLLANFPKIPNNKASIVDLCAGNGAVGLFVSQKTNCPITQIEIQPELSDMGQRSIELNQLTNQMTMINDDLKNSLNYIKRSSVDLLFCNPPYFKLSESTKQKSNQHLAIARHELSTNLDEVLSMSQQLLKTGGHLALVHRPNRFTEIFDTLRKYKLTPKKIQLVHPKRNSEANILLIDAIKDGGESGIKFLPSLIVHDDAGNYTDELRTIYFGK